MDNGRLLDVSWLQQGEQGLSFTFTLTFHKGFLEPRLYSSPKTTFRNQNNAWDQVPKIQLDP